MAVAEEAISKRVNSVLEIHLESDKVIIFSCIILIKFNCVLFKEHTKKEYTL